MRNLSDICVIDFSRPELLPPGEDAKIVRYAEAHFRAIGTVVIRNDLAKKFEIRAKNFGEKIYRGQTFWIVVRNVSPKAERFEALLFVERIG